MMKNLKYQLKKEARQFFKDYFHKQIKDLSYWTKHSICIELLDEVSNVYVDFGHDKGSRVDLCGWSSDGNKANFRFTLHVSDLEFQDYESIEIPVVMDKIQKVLDTYIKNL